MIAGPVLLLIVPLAMASVVGLLRRWTTLASLLAAGTAAFLGWIAIALPLDRTVNLLGRDISLGQSIDFLGRQLALQPSDQMALGFLFLTAAGLFVLAWRFMAQPWFPPVGLATLSLLGAALLVRPVIYAALLLEVAAGLIVFVLYDSRRQAAGGPLRYLSFTILGLPGLLIAHWLFDMYVQLPDETQLLGTATVLLTLSFALLLGIVPFHSWVPATAVEGHPLAVTFVFTVGNAAIWFLLFDYLATYPWLSQYTEFNQILRAVGIVMTAIAGLLSVAQQRPGRLLGYAVMADNGSMLIALSLASQLGLSAAFLIMLVRPLSLALVAIGLDGLRQRTGGQDDVAALRGVGWRAPWSTAAVLIGGISLFGFPVTAGFAGRWALYRALAASDVTGAVLLLLAALGVGVGLIKTLAVLLARPSTTETFPREPWPNVILISLTALACVLLGISPQWLSVYAMRLAEGFALFGR